MTYTLPREFRGCILVYT